MQDDLIHEDTQHVGLLQFLGQAGRKVFANQFTKILLFTLLRTLITS